MYELLYCKPDSDKETSRVRYQDDMGRLGKPAVILPFARRNFYAKEIQGEVPAYSLQQVYK
jgi:hypothetical protein